MNIRETAQLFIFVCILTLYSSTTEDFYELLGVSKNAVAKEIRQAFKRLALTLHPDKNAGDSEAQEKFLKVTRAYEVLKDPEARKKYDVHGEDTDGFNENREYHSWTFYNEQFGIYDDDPQIVTLSTIDFEELVENSDSIWFINFYSTHCTHCHHLAPTWRRVANVLEGAVNIGAVNCEEDWYLCQKEGINSYPSLSIYPLRQKHYGERTEESLVSFALDHVPVQFHTLRNDNFHISKQSQPWLISFCKNLQQCMDYDEGVILAAMLKDVVEVGFINCEKEVKLCNTLNHHEELVLYQNNNINILHQTTNKEIVWEALSLLPTIVKLEQEELEDLLMHVEEGTSQTAWLIHFVSDNVGNAVEWRKLKSQVANLRQVDCNQVGDLCQSLYINNFPAFAMFKIGGGFELHSGRATVNTIVQFARDSSNANVVSLGPTHFPRVMQDPSEAWFVDFMSPWCTPCRRLTPKWRSASKQMREIQVKFGTVDCSLHRNLCNQLHIKSYPTVLLYNGTNEAQLYHGQHTEAKLLEFIKECISPAVISLSEDTFESLVKEKFDQDIWIVDFYAPWCGHCIQMEPQWKKFAKLLSSLSNVHVGKVDCVTRHHLCADEGIRSYPVIKLYPTGGKGQVAIYSGHDRVVSSFLQWLLHFLPPAPVMTLTSNDFSSIVLQGEDVWLVDFFTPWCQHCHSFKPYFDLLSKLLEGKVKCAKLDCHAYQKTCSNIGIQAFPTIKYFSLTTGYEGEEISSQEVPTIMEWVQQLLQAEDSGNVHDEL